MSKYQLLQVKIIPSSTESLEEVVNKYIVKIFEETGNLPEVDTNSKFVTIKCFKSVEVNIKD